MNSNDTILFAFDLDGTLTTTEMLPVLAAELGIQEEMELLTRLTLNGVLPFAASFPLRVSLLRALPLRRIREIVAEIPLDPLLLEFIRRNTASCAIVTGNLDCWVAPLVERVGCACFSSTSAVRNGRAHLVSILDKGRVVRRMATGGKRIAAIGDSVVDSEMFKAAHWSIAFAGVHEPPAALTALATHTVRDAETLCRLLERLRRAETDNSEA